MLPAAIGHQRSQTFRGQTHHRLNIAALQVLRLDRLGGDIILRPLAPIPFGLDAKGLGIEHGVQANAVVLVGDRTDAAAAQFGLDVVHHGRSTKFDDLVANLERPCRQRYLHQAAILFRLVDALPVEHTDAESAVITEQFLPVIGQIIPDFLNRRRGVIGDHTQIPFTRNRAVDRVAAVQCQPVGR